MNIKRIIFSLIIVLTAVGMSPASAATYTIKRGDTLSKIAQTYGTSVDALAQINGISNPNVIQAGSQLEIPDALGAQIPTVVAVYPDSLASRITPSATSFTLTRGTDKQFRNLSGFYGFVIDEGTTSEEFLTANCIATACTIVGRGLDVVDGKTEVTALKFEHRRGASVKISNFPQLAVLSRILNGQESASSTFSIGDGTTGANKKLRADNGTTNLPYLQYNETSHSWQYSDDGVSTVSLSSGAAGGISASTTKGTFLTSSQLGVNASSTGSLAFDSNGALYVSPTFGADKTVTVNGPTVIAGAATSTGASFRVTATPSNGYDVVNKQYADVGFYASYATGTAYQSITAGQALYATPTSSIAVINTSSGTSTYSFVGFAANSVAAGSTVTYAKPGGIACTLSGLTPGAMYFLNGASGQISKTPSTGNARIGLALSSTCLSISFPHYYAVGSITYNNGTSGYTTTTLGFYPAKMSLVSGCYGTGTSANSFVNDAGVVQLKSAGVGTGVYDGSSAFACDNAGNKCLGSITDRSSTGFTVQESLVTTCDVKILYTAESL